MHYKAPRHALSTAASGGATAAAAQASSGMTAVNGATDFRSRERCPFHQATQQRKFLEFEASRGESAVGGQGEAFGRLIRAEYDANAEILKRLGLAKKN